jgi:hypothetical protein
MAIARWCPTFCLSTRTSTASIATYGLATIAWLGGTIDPSSIRRMLARVLVVTSTLSSSPSRSVTASQSS